MEMTKVTPKDFFLWAAAMLALYVAVFNYIALVWDYINYVMPDPLQTYFPDPYQNGISWEMATLIQERCSVVLGVKPSLTRVSPKADEVSDNLDYRIDCLLKSGFLPHSDRIGEIDHLLNFCKVFA